MRTDAEIWAEMAPEIFPMHERFEKPVVGRDSLALGEIIHQTLVGSMERCEPATTQVLAFTDNSIAMCSIGFEDRAERWHAHRLAGRFFANALQEPVRFLVQMFAVWIGTEDELPPGQQNDRKEGALTFLIELQTLLDADGYEQYLEALQVPFMRVWHTYLHEGLVTDEIYKGDYCLPLSRQDEDHGFKDVAYMDSAGASELLIGYSSSIPAVNQITASAELQERLEKDVAEAEATK